MKWSMFFIVLVLSLQIAIPTHATTICEVNAHFDEINNFAQTFITEAVSELEDYQINRDAEDWATLIDMVVSAGEGYLNECLDPEDEDALIQWAEASQFNIAFPVVELEAGSEIQPEITFETVATTMDLDGNGEDEFLLNIQIPYFAITTIFSVHGGVVIAYHETEDGWQGRVIAPGSYFVSDEEAEYPSFAMTEDYAFETEDLTQALIFLPEISVELVEIADADEPLIAVTQDFITGAGEAKELTILNWNDAEPQVLLRVMFDDWCYPGRILNWEIRDNGDVFVPSNDNDPDSPLHCGRTPEILFTWDGEQYTANEQ